MTLTHDLWPMAGLPCSLLTTRYSLLRQRARAADGVSFWLTLRGGRPRLHRMSFGRRASHEFRQAVGQAIVTSLSLLVPWSLRLSSLGPLVPWSFFGLLATRWPLLATGRRFLVLNFEPKPERAACALSPLFWGE